MSCFSDLSTVAIVEDVPPLVYYRSANMLRLAAVDPAAPPPPPWAIYFVPTKEMLRTKTGRTYKKPRYKTVPGAAPGVVAFLDYHVTRYPDTPNYTIYIDYVKTREDQRGRGLMCLLLDALWSKYPGASFDFGRIMTPTVWNYYMRKREAGCPVHGHRYF